jgi:hypothetical protein
MLAPVHFCSFDFRAMTVVGRNVAMNAANRAYFGGIVGPCPFCCVIAASGMIL